MLDPAPDPDPKAGPDPDRGPRVGPDPGRGPRVGRGQGRGQKVDQDRVLDRGQKVDHVLDPDQRVDRGQDRGRRAGRDLAADPDPEGQEVGHRRDPEVGQGLGAGRDRGRDLGRLSRAAGPRVGPAEVAPALRPPPAPRPAPQPAPAIIVTSAAGEHMHPDIGVSLCGRKMCPSCCNLVETCTPILFLSFVESIQTLVCNASSVSIHFVQTFSKILNVETFLNSHQSPHVSHQVARESWQIIENLWSLFGFRFGALGVDPSPINIRICICFRQNGIK